MKWIQIGLSKSGNYWLYQILQNIASHAHLEQKSFIQKQPIHAIAKTWKLGFPEQCDIDHLSVTDAGFFYNIGSIFHMPIDDIDDYVSQCSHVWMHSPVCSRTMELLKKFSKIIYIVRDPRDISISLSHFAFTPYRLRRFGQTAPSPETHLKNSLAYVVFSWVSHVIGYLKLKSKYSIYFLFYENLLSNFQAEVRKLLNYLDVKVADEDIRIIERLVSFDTLKTKSGDHLRKGKSAQWAELFNEKQMKEISAIAGPLLKCLGYPISKGNLKNGEILLRLPERIESRFLDRALVRAQRYRRIDRAKKFLGKTAYDLFFGRRRSASNA